MELDAHDHLVPTLLGEAVANSSHAVFVTEEYWGRVLAVNDAACRLLGYSRSELLELTGKEFSAGEPEVVAHAYRRATGNEGRARATATMRRKDGSLVAIDYWLTPTTVGGIDFVLTVTEPIAEARPATG